MDLVAELFPEILSKEKHPLDRLIAFAFIYVIGHVNSYLLSQTQEVISITSFNDAPTSPPDWEIVGYPGILVPSRILSWQ